MDALRIFAERLLAPAPLLFTLAAALLLVALRSPLPWTRAGGAVLAIAGAAFTALVLADPVTRGHVTEPERLPAALLIAASCVLVWLVVHQERSEKPVPVRPGKGALPAGELLAGGFLLLAAALGAFVLGAPLGPAADLRRPPAAADAPWFLRGLQELGNYFDPWVTAGLVPLLFLLGLAALPFFDLPPAKSVAGPLRARREMAFLFVLVYGLLVLLPLLTGTFLRADLGQEPPVPSQPLETRGLFPDADAGAAARSPFVRVAPFSVKAWSLVRETPPRRAVLRELPGLFLLAAFFVLPPTVLPRWRPTRAVFSNYRRRLGRRRFHLAMALLTALFALPLKMYCSWLLGVEYLLYFPEIGLNF